MNFQIKNIILWPKNPELAIRIIPFNLNQVNVITGASRTGKSALIPIIDYCLASTSCRIPVNVIRNACSWFGVIIETSNGDCLFARREPGDLKSTDDMFVQEGEAINITNVSPTKNTTAEQVRLQLGELAGLSKLDFSAYSDWGFNGRISFKDLSAFMFQPQNVIANPDILFYKTDTQEHRQKLRTIFPYILGAITPEILLKQHQLKQLETLLQKKERELNNIQEVSERWLGELKSHVIRAQEFGLLQSDNINNLSKNEMVDLINGIVTSKNRERKIKPPSIKESINKLDEIEKQELDFSTKLTSLRRRMQEIKRLESTTEEFFNAQTKQIDRLRISSWFSDSFELNGECPICHNILKSEQSTLNFLLDSLKERSCTICLRKRTAPRRKKRRITP